MGCGERDSNDGSRSLCPPQRMKIGHGVDAGTKPLVNCRPPAPAYDWAISVRRDKQRHRGNIACIIARGEATRVMGIGRLHLAHSSGSERADSPSVRGQPESCRQGHVVTGDGRLGPDRGKRRPEHCAFCLAVRQEVKPAWQIRNAPGEPPLSLPVQCCQEGAKARFQRGVSTGHPQISLQWTQAGATNWSVSAALKLNACQISQET